MINSDGEVETAIIGAVPKDVSLVRVLGAWYSCVRLGGEPWLHLAGGNCCCIFFWLFCEGPRASLSFPL